MRLVIFGVGPLARLMDRCFRDDTDHQVVAFTADREHVVAPTFLERPVVPFEELAIRHPPSEHGVFVAVGYRRMRARREVFQRVKERGYACPSYVSPRAILHHPERLGENNVVMDQVLIEPFVEIGDDNLFGAGTLVSHEARIGNHSYFSARVLIGGRSTVGDGCFFGNLAATINDLQVGDEAMLLAGAVAMRDCAPFTKYLGNPAQAVGTHRADGIVIERG